MQVILQALVQLALGILTQGPEALRQLIDIGEQVRAYTPEQAALYREQMNTSFASRAWMTDAQLAAQQPPPPAPGETPPMASEPPRGPTSPST